MRVRADQRHRAIGRLGRSPLGWRSFWVASGDGLPPIAVKEAGSPARAGRTRLWRRVLVLAVAAMLAACGGGTAGGGAGGMPTLNWYIFPEPSGSFRRA